MQSKDGKRFTGKKSAMVVLSLCLVGAAAVSTYYAMDLSKDRAEEEYMVDLNENPKTEETEAEAVLAPEVTADFSDGATEMDVDPSTLVVNDDSAVQETETEGETEMMTESNVSSQDGQSAAVSENNEADEETADVMSGGVEAQIQPTVSFASSESLQWPVAGTLLMDYSMDATVYFATLDQYKYNPATIFSAEEGTAVTACAQGKVTSIFENEEIGKAVTLDLGDGYEATYGQLAEITVKENAYVNPGETIGSVAAPTKYYSAEGSNVYFALTHNGDPVNGEALFH